jgi:hypothetical protein
MNCEGGYSLGVRDELLKDVSAALGYRRLRARTEEVLRTHLRSAIRCRRIHISVRLLFQLGQIISRNHSDRDIVFRIGLY